MKIFFVGMFNKPNMTPLDSRTKTGKIIDAIVKQLPFECVKTNLCDCEYLPKDKNEIRKFNFEWQEKHNPCDEDIIVLLGSWVNKYFSVKWNKQTIPCMHPAAIYGTERKQEYISAVIGIINSVALVLNSMPIVVYEIEESNKTLLRDTVAALDEIRKHTDLRNFQIKNEIEFAKKYGITASQVNFLIAVVAAERIKEIGLPI